ncbi:MAG: hypothetical protein OEZ58_12105 [Gammaproteobacteria bacterium]|nr:hypothetical protein [Gammaproteobacteria bacterium]
MKRLVQYIVLVISIIVTSVAFAEVGIIPTKSKPTMADVNVGFDSAILTSGVGYGQRVDLEALNKEMVVFGDFSIPMTKPDFNDFRLRLGIYLIAYKRQSFSVPIEFIPILRGAENATFRSVGFGTALGVVPGWYFAKWFIAGETIWDQQWTSYIEHSDYYKKNVYPAKDGWLSTPAKYFQFGLRGGGIIRDKYELILRAGYEHRGKYGLQNLTPSIYVISSIGFRW